jgi:hypothetical protein
MIINPKTFPFDQYQYSVPYGTPDQDQTIATWSCRRRHPGFRAHADSSENNLLPDVARTAMTAKSVWEFLKQDSGFASSIIHSVEQV